MTDVFQEIAELFARRGQETYGEGVSQAEHALQCAALAQEDTADDMLIVAALLHDIGHFIEPPDDGYGYHRHDRSGGDWLGRRFGPAVSEPVRLHVAAKRYLCAVEPGYAERLSDASRYSLAKQGGPMSPDEAAAFAANPRAEQAQRLRRWDDAGKLIGRRVPGLADFRARIERTMSPASGRSTSDHR